MEWESEPLVDIVESLHQGLNTAGEKIKFEEVGFPIIQTRNIDNGQINLDHKIKFISQGDWDKYNEKYKPQVGDVFFTNIGTIGKTAIVHVEQDYLIHWNIFKIRPIPDKITSAYLKYRLDYLTDTGFFTASQKGGTVNFVTKKMMSSVEVPLPPIPEQKRIVAILDEAFADIDRARELTERNLKNARELFDSYLNQIFTQKGEGWSRMTLGSLGKVSMCKRVLKKQTTALGDIPFYKIGTFGKEPDAYIPKELYDEFRLKYSFPKAGDILISASGTIGRRVIYDGQPSYFQDSNIVWIDNDECAVLNDYLYHFYGACDWNPSKGATISRLYNDDLRRIEISYPEKSVQAELVKTIDELSLLSRTLQNKYHTKLLALDELKKSMLQKAFSGELNKEDHAA